MSKKVSNSTVYWKTNSLPHIKREKTISAPLLTDLDKEKRKQFAKQYIQLDFTQVQFLIIINEFLFFVYLHKVLFSDEKKFNLEGPDGFNLFWRDLRKEPLLFSKRNFCGGSVMVWGGFTAFEKCNIVHCKNKMNSDDYI